MVIETSYKTDIGRKQVNEDSCLIDTAETSLGPAAFAVLADGMGGLQKGELASAEIIRTLDEWFLSSFPSMLEGELSGSTIFDAWMSILNETNMKLRRYGSRLGAQIGTTVVILLAVADHFYFMNIGDSRIYEVTEEGLQTITKDHTLVMHEVEQGRLTLEQMEQDPRRNILLQCIGALERIDPYFSEGRITKDTVYVLCSDGFRHMISAEEIYNAMRPSRQFGEDQTGRNLRSLIEMDLQRGETDNITAVAVRVRP